MSRGTGAEWKETWSRRDNASWQNLSCSAAGAEGRERGCEDMGKRCCTAHYRQISTI